MKRNIIAFTLFALTSFAGAQTDYTSRITNPSFETGDLTGWTSKNMGTMDNAFFDIKQGTWYVEKWTGRGSSVGDARLSQKLTGMPAGRYRLTVAAQNIQEDTPTKAQTGAWIFAGTHTTDVTVRNEYSIEFLQVADVMEIGFEASGATGNWLSVDNFRLEYLSDNFDEVKAAFKELLDNANFLATQNLDATTLQTLNDALTAAQAAYDASDASLMPSTATALEAAVATATFVYRILNSSGTPPKVTTDPRFIRGCTWAFGRSTVTGSDIIEEGFCWSEQPDPKVTDHRTTEYINQAGKIYWLRDLKPATIYYMRAYAMTKDYAVGYGDVIKVVTVPKGTVSHHPSRCSPRLLHH